MQILNIDDKALIIRNFLPKDILNKVRNFNFTDFTDSTKLEENPWGESLYSARKKRNVKDVKISSVKIDMLEEVENLIIENSHIPTRKEKYSFGMAFFVYEKNSGINWHNDNAYDLNFSIYIHDDWDSNWGGETLIDTERGLPLASIPYPNTLLCIKRDVKHKVCAVTSDVQRKVLQCRYNFIN